MARKKETTDVSAEIEKLTRQFTADLQDLIERAVAERTAEVAEQLQEVQTALNGIVGARPSKPKLRKRPERRMSKADAKEKVLAALTEAGEPIGSTALQQATGLSAARIRSAAAALIEENKVAKEGDKRSTVYFVKD
jgi:transcriptional regulator of heat shock response